MRERLLHERYVSGSGWDVEGDASQMGCGGQLGDVAAKLQSNVTDVLVHDLDMNAVSDGNHLSDRRPELYGILSDVNHPSRQPDFSPSEED